MVTYFVLVSAGGLVKRFDFKNPIRAKQFRANAEASGIYDRVSEVQLEP